MALYRCILSVHNLHNLKNQLEATNLSNRIVLKYLSYNSKNECVEKGKLGKGA